MIKAILFLVCFMHSMANESAGVPTKGMIYYKYLIKEKVGIRGDLFSKQYTTKEWITLFDNNATLFKKQFSGIDPQLDTLLNSAKFLEIMPHLKAFVIHYAKDKTDSATCEEKE